MTQARRTATALRLCLWCLVGVVVEIGLYFSYTGHDARFHWLLLRGQRFFVGSAVALLVMALVASWWEKPVPYPLVWPVTAHVFAMFPDLLFTAGIAHYWWMDLFLGISAPTSCRAATSPGI